MTAQIPAWKSDQLVTQAQMNPLWNSLLFDNSLQNADRENPCIMEGLDVTVSDVGTATVTAGVVLGEAFTSADNAGITSPIYPFSQLVTNTDIAVTSGGEEYGYIVLTQTIVAVAGDVDKNAQAITARFDVDVSLNYRPGTATYYPLKVDHDTILAGVYTTSGGDYIVYKGIGDTSGSTTQVLRAEDKDDHYQTSRQRNLSSDPHFYPWINATDDDVVVGVSSTEDITSIWLLFNESSTQTLTASTVAVSGDDQKLLSYPALSLTKLVRAGASTEAEIQLRSTYAGATKIIGQWVTCYVEYRLVSANATVTMVTGIQLANHEFSARGAETITVSTGYKLAKFQIYIDKDALEIVTFSKDTPFEFKFNIYTLDSIDIEISSLYFVNGRTETMPQEALIDQRSINAAVLEHKKELAADTGSTLMGTALGQTAQEILPAAILYSRYDGVTETYDIDNTLGNINAPSRTGAGRIDITFTSAMPNSDYILVGSTSNVSSGNPCSVSFYNKSVNGFTVVIESSQGEGAKDQDFSLIITTNF